MTENHAELIAVAAAFLFMSQVTIGSFVAFAQKYVSCAALLYVAYRVMTRIMGAA